jgi:hypothetical protein
VDEQALVALPVLVVVAHLLGGDADRHLAVGVAEQDHAPGDGSPLAGIGCVLRCRIRITSVSTYSGLVEYSVFQPVTCVGGWMW